MNFILKCVLAWVLIASALTARAAEYPVYNPHVRVYIMRGLLELSPGTGDLGAQIAKQDTVVQVGSWMQREQFVQDALRHPHDKIIFVGHSMGAYEAAAAANELLAHGIHALVVGIDPLCTAPPALGKGIRAVNFYGNGCLFNPNAVFIFGARNVNIARFGDSHIGIVADPRVRRLVVDWINAQLA